MSVPSVRFRVRKEKGKSPIVQCHISIYGKISPRFSTQIRATNNLKWNQKKQQFEPLNDLAISNNNILLEIKAIVNDCFLILKNEHKPITAAILKKNFIKVWRKEKTSYTLHEVFDNYLKNVISQQNLEPKTLNKYDNAKKKLTLFLKTFNKVDIEIEEVSLQFGHKFFKFMTTSLGLSDGTAKRYLQYMNAALEYAFQEELIDKNPLNGIKVKAKANPINKTIIPEALQLKIYNLDSLTETEKHISKITTFMFYTVFDHCDYFEFDANKHVKEVEGEKVIEKIRFKQRKSANAQLCSIRINNILQEILDTYPTLPRYPAKTVLEVYRNLCSRVGFKDWQKIGLKQIRKSGATYYLNNDVPLKIVSEKILGHTTVIMTEKHYVKVTRDTALRHTKHLSNRK